MLSAMQCRANSVKCVRMAREAAAPQIRAVWTNMARTWTTLAAQTDHIEKITKREPPACSSIKLYHYRSESNKVNSVKVQKRTIPF